MSTASPPQAGPRHSARASSYAAGRPPSSRARARASAADEAVGVDVDPGQVQPVADGGASDARALRAERATGPADGGVQGSARVDREVLAPHVVDEPVAGDDPTPRDEQGREQPSRAACWEGALATVDDQVGIAQDVDVYGGHLPSMHAGCPLLTRGVHSIVSHP